MLVPLLATSPEMPDMVKPVIGTPVVGVPVGDPLSSSQYSFVESLMRILE